MSNQQTKRHKIYETNKSGKTVAHSIALPGAWDTDA
jgi:hypothetical protein